MKKIVIFTFIAATFLGACKRKTTTTTTTSTSTTGTTPVDKIPTACFQLSVNTAELNSKVNVVQCSRDGYYWEWNFGDSTPIDTVEKPAHTYKKLGKFTVTLKIYSYKKTFNRTTTQEITIGERYIDSVVVKAVNFTEPITKKPWDFNLTTYDSTGPDLFFRCGPTAAANYLYDGKKTMDVKDDVKPSDVPFQWPLFSSSVSYKLTNEAWDWALFDLDKSQSTEQQLFLITNLNPITSANKDPKIPIKLANGGHSVYIYWSIR
ncbi:MAG: PKD domain-containing protein [Bacteroidetes bacterium]|nr:PKD domain-containing protein [Bacteroidota bacterium]